MTTPDRGTARPTSARMGEMPIPRLLFSIAAPVMLSMFVSALYNIIDSVFVSRFDPRALTAVSLAFPVQTLLTAVGVGTGVGINSLISRRLGEGRREEARAAAHNGVFVCAVAYLFFALFGLFGTEAFFGAYTDDPDIRRMGVEYLSTCMTFSFGQMMVFAVTKLMQSTSYTVGNMVVQLSGALLNIALDPLLIFGFGFISPLGARGAAIATVFSQNVAMVVAFCLNQTRNRELRLNFRGFRPRLQPIRDIYAVGFPSIVMQSINSIATLCLNAILIQYSAVAVSVLGVYFKLNSFVFMPIFGLTGALVAVVGYNFGARKKERLRKAVRVALLSCGTIMVVGTLLFQILPSQMLSLFDPAGDLLEMGVPALRIVSLSFLSAAVCIVLSTVFQAVGHGFLSLLCSVCRQIVVLLPAAWLLSRFAGVQAVWWAFLIAECLSLTLHITLYARVERRYIAPL